MIADPADWDELPRAAAEEADLEAEAVSVADADPVARHELAYLTPEYIERAAVTRRNHDNQVAALGPLARDAHRTDCPLCIARALPVAEAPADPQETDPETGDLPIVYTVGALAELPSADELYIIGDGILTVGGKLLLYAKSGAGKTTLLDFLAGPLSTGTPFLGRFPVDRPLRVLVVQGELSLPEMSSHAQQLVGAGFDSDNLMFVRMTKLKLPEGEDYLRRIIARHRPDVLCLDPWYRLFAGESSDKPEQVGSVFDVCDRLLDEGLILAAVVVHHANVTGLRTAGSWVFEGWPSTILRLEKVPGTTHRKLTFEKVRAPSSTLDGREVRIALGETGYLMVEAVAASATAGAITAALIVAQAGGQLHRKELIDRLMGRAGCKQRAAAKYLGDAVQARRLVTVRDGNSTLYQVPEAAPEADR